jgi:hypothetical protein
LKFKLDLSTIFEKYSWISGTTYDWAKLNKCFLIDRIRCTINMICSRNRNNNFIMTKLQINFKRIITPQKTASCWKALTGSSSWDKIAMLVKSIRSTARFEWKQVIPEERAVR